MPELKIAKTGFIARLDSSLGALTIRAVRPVVAGLRALNLAIKAAQGALYKYAARSRTHKLNSAYPSIQMGLPQAPKLENGVKVWLN